MRIRFFPDDLSVESFDTASIFTAGGADAGYLTVSGTLTLEGGPTCKPIDCPTEQPAP